jgi:putative ABC transport system permease protein
VISKALNEKLFNGQNSVGKPLRMDGHTFNIVGVLDEWNPNPHFYDLETGRYGDSEDIFVPVFTALDLKFGRNGNMNCWDNANGEETALNAPCVWMQYWVELASPADAGDYRAYLENYSAQQKAAGRFQRPSNVRLRNVMEWLDFKQVVPSDVRLQLWLALGFLAVCLINTVGLLLAKFLRRSGEIGVRRALGASRGQIFLQSLVEAGTVGLAGGVLGLGLALLGLYAVRQQPVDYAKLATLDGKMLLLTFGLTLAASLLAGFLPALRAMQVTPAIQLKSQ